MSLVAYGSSDESDSEELTEKQEPISVVSTDSKVNNDDSSNNHIINGKKDSDDKTEKVSYDSFSKLKLTTNLLENSLKILDKNRSQPIRITIPSLDEIKKNTEDKVKDDKKKSASTTSTGLLALLAPPKNELHATTSRNMNTNSAKINKPSTGLVPRSVVRAGSKNESKADTKVEEEIDDWDSGKSFFFSSNEDEQLEYEPIEPELKEDVSSRGHDVSNLNNVGNEISVSEPIPSTSYHIEPENERLQVDAEALEKLCGRSERKRAAIDFQEQIIDVHADSLLGEANLWLTKDLTVDKPVSSKKTKSLSSVERRKHQITYLASQAKEKEMELRNQWANNRMTKKQTQAKYGF